MRRHRRVKILATLGPASSNPEMAGKLFEAGADVFRLNMSHLPREQLADKVAMLRALESVYRRPVGILVDLQGPKLRVGAFADEAGVMLDVGATFTLDSDKKPGDATRVHLPHPEILQALEKGHALRVVGHGCRAGSAFWGGEVPVAGAQYAAHQLIEHCKLRLHTQSRGKAAGLLAQLRQGILAAGVAGFNQALLNGLAADTAVPGPPRGLKVFKQQPGQGRKVQFALEHGRIARCGGRAFPEHDGQARQLHASLGAGSQVDDLTARRTIGLPP
jgi:hypothetical protein